MIKIDKIVTASPEQWQIAIEGMRNPKNSWDKIDSTFCSGSRYMYCTNSDCPFYSYGNDGRDASCTKPTKDIILGENDLKLALGLIRAGTEHRKFLRMLPVTITLTAPLYFWKQLATYKIGTTLNSCSTMHKLMDKPLTIDDFSTTHLERIKCNLIGWNDSRDKAGKLVTGKEYFEHEYIDTINGLIRSHKQGVNSKHESDWEIAKDLEYAAFEVLPESYMQKRTWYGSMENLIQIKKQRSGHKLTDDWSAFIEYIEKNVPYFNLFYDAATQIDKKAEVLKLVKQILKEQDLDKKFASDLLELLIQKEVKEENGTEIKKSGNLF